MNKILIISIISVFLNLISTSHTSLYLYKYGSECKFYESYKGSCYEITIASGYPLGYLPYKPDTPYDGYYGAPPDVDIKNFIINFVFYYIMINILISIYKKNKKQIKFITTHNSYCKVKK